MQTFQLYIDDDRYSVATLNLIAVKDAKRARSWAEATMVESPHHLGVEVYRGGAWLFGIGTMAEQIRDHKPLNLVGF